ncbi:BTB/POZ domain-containing protein [Criblamydia sequanensis]|uniref:BTB domain-containing protein n=1 Tax=Candidatus Criblamydia sequanensis CRIB-18 TaxID=1437425 RepID=A0A090D0L7_9BACT|nr:BTB/POZ domain-containing protein [Criblamydia sequanensis]CDR33113.1 hypothetical protein CSEC_0274 [Criblamydia sequanensis CRIB-18]
MTFNITKAAHELAEAKTSHLERFFASPRSIRPVQSSSSKRKFQEIEIDWFRLPLNSIQTESAKWQATDAINEFFLSLAKCQTLADLSLATSGDETELASFRSALRVINYKILRCKSDNPSLFGGQPCDESLIAKGLKIRNDEVLNTVKRILSLCKKHFKEKKNQAVILKDLPKALFEQKGVIAPAHIETAITDDELILWASSLPSSLRESVTFFNFSRYPNLSPEAPALLKEVFPNISFACFGNLPESLCDVTLVPTREISEAFNPEISSQGSFPIPVEEEDEGELVIYDPEDEQDLPLPGSKGKEKVVEEAGQEEKISCIPGKVLKSETYEKSIIEDSSEEQIEIRTNRKILASCSPFFKQLFFGGMKEAALNRVYIREVRPHVFEACMKVLFSKTDLKEVSLPVLIEVLKTAHLLELPSVIEKVKCQIILQLENLEVTEENVQAVCQGYFDLENILKIDQESLIENAIILFLKKSLLEVDASSVKGLLVTFINNDLPIIKIFKFLKQEGNHQVKKAKTTQPTSLKILFRTLIEASLECQGKFLEEVVQVTSSYWKSSLTPGDRLDAYFRLLRACTPSRSIPISLKRKLFYKMLKEAESFEHDGMILNRRNSKIGNSRKKAFLEVTNDILESFGVNVSSETNNFSDPSRLSEHLGNLAEACQTLPHPGKKIAHKLASMAVKVDDKNEKAKILALLYKSLAWGTSRRCFEGLDVRPYYAKDLLTLMTPSLKESANINDFFNVSSTNPAALSLSALIRFYHPMERDWPMIFLQTEEALKTRPFDDLALALQGACYFHFALKDPSKKDEFYKASIKNLKNALSYNSKNTIALLYLANCYFKLGKISKATALFKTIKCNTVIRDNEDMIRFSLERSGEDFEEANRIIMEDFNLPDYGLAIPEMAFQDKSLLSYNLFAKLALKKMNETLLKKAQFFLENFCLAKESYNEETLTLLEEIYTLKEKAGGVDANKKQALKTAYKNLEARSVEELISNLLDSDSSSSFGSTEIITANDSIGTSGSNNFVEASNVSTSGSESADDGRDSEGFEIYDNLDVDSFFADMPFEPTEEPSKDS